MAFLEIFLYLKNNNSVEHVQNVLLIELFIYFQGKITSILVDLVVLNFDFDLVTPFYILKWNRYFSACKRKSPKFFMSF